MRSAELMTYHAFVVAWNAICKHGITKLIKAIAGISLDTLGEQMVQIRCDSHGYHPVKSDSKLRQKAQEHL